MIPTFDLEPTRRAASDYSLAHPTQAGSYWCPAEYAEAPASVEVHPDRLRVWVSGRVLSIELRLRAEDSGWYWLAEDLDVAPVVAWIMEGIVLPEYATATPEVAIDRETLTVTLERTPIAYA